MTLFDTRRLKPGYQYLAGIALVFLTALACYISTPYIGYKTVALLLMVTVSVAAMLFDTLPVIIAAVISALTWNFFFIPPVFTFHIDSTEDLLMFLLYFFIAMVNAVLTLQIRKEEKKARDKEEKEKTILLYNTLLNALSHELRTPISAIIGAVDVLKESDTRISTDNRSELLNQIDIAGGRLNRQVENLLNMSRLESGTLRLNPDWCDTNELISAVICKITLPYKQTIVFEPDNTMPLIKMDRGLIEQVIQNLLHNAISYTPDDTTVKITTAYLNGMFVLHMADNGPGIPQSHIPQLFDKFYRLPQSKTGGSGLGLSIVKGFTEAHQGKVNALSNRDGGVTFIVEFPAEASPCKL